MDQKNIRLLKGLSTGLVIAAMVFAFLIAGIRIFGVQVYGVLTGSMEPTYPTGSLIYVKAVDASDLRVNDVITFSVSPGVIATHRIVEIVPDETYPTLVRYRTKGDANRDVDASLVSANNIIGKALFAVPHLGNVANYIQQPPGIYVAILVCGLMIAFVFYTDSLEEKQKKQSPTAVGEGKAAFDLTAAINQLSQKLLGKPLIKQETPPEPVGHQGYVPRQTVQQYPQQMMQQYPQQYPPQGYPQYSQPYPQQGYQQQGYQPYGGMQQYPRQGQYAPQYQQPYPQGQQVYDPQQGAYPQQPVQSQPQYYPQQGYYPQQPAQDPYTAQYGAAQQHYRSE